MFTAASYTIAKVRKQPKYLLRNEWIKNMWYKPTRARVRAHTHTHTHTHTQVENYSAKKKNKILPFVVTWMALEGINLSEINQTKKCYKISLLCGG